VSVERLHEMGYEKDEDGEPLRDGEQVVELKPQDVVLSRDSAEHLTRVADFVDDLLDQYYGVEPYHELDGTDDLVGELVMGLAPHTSAGVLGRVVGFTDASVGYAHPFFHAAKRRNCFAPDTKVYYIEGSEGRRYETVERLVEARISEAEEDDIHADDFGGVVVDTEGVEVPSLDDDGNVVKKPVEAVSRHPAPDHLVEVKTRSGREVVVTPDHEMQVYDGGTVTTKRASEVSEGDSLMTPRRYVEGDEERQTRTLDLLDEFVSSDSVDNERLMVHGIGKRRLYGIFEDELADGTSFDVLVDTSNYLGVTKKALSNYVYRDSVPVSVLIDLIGTRERLVDAVPDDISLGVKRDNTTVHRHVEIDEDVATLLGYYAAEGFSRSSETSKGVVHQTTFCGTEEEMRDFYVETLCDGFGVEPYRENHAKVTVSGRLFRLVFDEVLEAGSGAKEKRVPQHLFDSPRDVVAAYLRGYFSGDGSVENGRLVVEATTVSRELKRDLTALLTRVGVKARSNEYESVRLNRKFPDHYADDDVSMSATRFVLTVSSNDAVRFAEDVGFHLPRKSAALADAVETVDVRKRRVFDGGGPRDAFIDTVESVGYTRSKVDYVYCLTVEDTHSLIVNDLASKQCDGDEDCVTLMSDALINFSREYLPDQRGGRMDAPLVMTSRIDPTEIDDEAHNVDKVSRYPLSFYEAADEYAHPKEVDVRIAEDDLGTDTAFDGFGSTVETSRIDSGPDNSAYKILPSMDEKTTAQLEIGRKTRAVDESDVAERVVESHFLPDLIGNLRAFTQQEFRCLDCNQKFRRPPLSGDCDCGGEVTLTVHKGSVKKYLDVALETGEKYGVSDYTMQRLEQLRRQIDSLFEDDKSTQSGIADFM
ncbi:MAG: LAGLIDADG family homing endonuclease, partial [Halobacteriales archaeon]